MSGAVATCKIYADLGDKLMADNALANPETMQHCVEKMSGIFGESVEFAMLVQPFLKCSGTFDEVMGVCGKYWTGYKFEGGKCTVKPGRDAANATVVVDADIYAIDEDKKEIQGTRKGHGQVTHYFTTNADGKIIKWTQEFDADHINLCRAKLDAVKAKWRESSGVMSGAEATCQIYAELGDKLMADNALANPETMQHCVEKMRGLFGESVEFAMLVRPFLKCSGTFAEVMGACGKYWTGYKFEGGKCTVKPGKDAYNAIVVVDADIYAIDEDKKEINGTRKGLGQVTHYFTTNDDQKIIKWTQEFDADHINLCRAKLDGVKAKWHESWVLSVPMFSQGMFATTTPVKPEPHNMDQPFKRDSEKGDDVYGAISGWGYAVADAPVKQISHGWEEAAEVWHDQSIHFDEEADPNQPLSPTLLTSKVSKGKEVSAKKTSDPLPPSRLEGVWPKVVMTMEVNDFNVWYEGFALHADSKTGSWGFELPVTRSEIVDDEQTLVLRSTKNPNRVMVVMTDVRSHKTEALIVNPNKMRATVEKVQYILGEKLETKAVKAALDPPGPDVPTSDLAAWMQVANFDVWSKGFWENATSTTGSWGFKVPIARGEWVDESRTEVFRGLAGGKYGGPNHVGITLFNVENARLDILGDPSFVKLTEVLGEMAQTKVIKIMADAF